MEFRKRSPQLGVTAGRDCRLSDLPARPLPFGGVLHIVHALLNRDVIVEHLWKGDAVNFFDRYVEGEVQDKAGRRMTIDAEDGLRFMYKEQGTARHVVDPRNYQPHRGKRLPWIKHTITHTVNVYTRADSDDRELMYVHKYRIAPNMGGHLHYWVVIAKKNKRDRESPYKFKTAFPVFKYNSLLRRLERYEPADAMPNAT